MKQDTRNKENVMIFLKKSLQHYLNYLCLSFHYLNFILYREGKIIDMSFEGLIKYDWLETTWQSFSMVEQVQLPCASSSLATIFSSSLHVI